jgi:membrane protein implicated in regulation of membrane protease activity
MYTFFLICAGVGGTLIILQLIAGSLGIGGDHADAAGHGDFGGDHGADGHDADHGDGNWFLGLLTFRSLCAAITFFGLGGLVASYYELQTAAQLGSALAAGILALYLVATLMKALYKLKADGTVRIKHAVGQTGTVYLRVPGQNSGPGKVTVNLQNRTVELEAFTAADELPTGTPIRIVAVRGPNSVEVTHVHATSEA